MSALHVVAVTPLYPPVSRVGAWLATHGCLRAAVARRHRVDVYPVLAQGAKYTLDGVRVVPGQRRVTAELLASADVVVSHMGDNGQALRVASALGTPSVVMAHGEPKKDVRELWAEYPPTVVVWNSENLRATVGYDGPSVVINPPVDVQAHATTPGDRVTLVNLSDDKGGRVFNRIAAAMPDTQFLGVRGGYGLQRARPGRNVEVRTSTRNMKRDVWSRTRVLLMPSRFETWGMVGVEAMCSGIPVVAAPTEGLRESLGNAGIFVERTDVRGWVQALHGLGDARQWAEASEAATARAKELAAQNSAGMFVELLETVAAKRQTARG